MLFPSVSGTNTATNTVPIKLTIPNAANVDEIPIESTMSWKHLIATIIDVQLQIVLAKMAVDFTSFGNIFSTMIQGIGPEPTLKAVTKIETQKNGNQLNTDTLCVF